MKGDTITCHDTCKSTDLELPYFRAIRLVEMLNYKTNAKNNNSEIL
jgi:hypothetical protein